MQEDECKLLRHDNVKKLKTIHFAVVLNYADEHWAAGSEYAQTTIDRDRHQKDSCQLNLVSHLEEVDAS